MSIKATQPEDSAVTDEQILALNADERFFSESPTKYPESGHGTQYHAGAPGVIGFARAVLALATPSPQPATTKEAEGEADPMNYKGMFLDAVRALAQIDALLGLPEDGCNDPQVTVSALQDYMAGVAERKAHAGGST